MIDGSAQNIETWIWRKTLKSLLRLTLISKTVWQPWKFGSSGLRNLSPDMRVQAYKTFWISEFSRNFHNKEEISSWVKEFHFPLMSGTQRERWHTEDGCQWDVNKKLAWNCHIPRFWQLFYYIYLCSLIYAISSFFKIFFLKMFICLLGKIYLAPSSEMSNIRLTFTLLWLSLWGQHYKSFLVNKN